MISIDIFGHFAQQASTDRNVHKYGTFLLTRGVSGAKLNPVTVWVDAAVAVLEASKSYLRYRSSTERTEQLRLANQALEATLTQDLKLEKLALTRLQQQQTMQLTQRQRELERITAHATLTRAKIRQQLDLLHTMQAVLQKEHLQVGNFQHLTTLQMCLDQCIDSTLALLLNPTGE